MSASPSKRLKISQHTKCNSTGDDVQWRHCEIHIEGAAEASLDGRVFGLAVQKDSGSDAWIPTTVGTKILERMNGGFEEVDGVRHFQFSDGAPRPQTPPAAGRRRRALSELDSSDKENVPTDPTDMNSTARAMAASALVTPEVRFDHSGRATIQVGGLRAFTPYRVRLFEHRCDKGLTAAHCAVHFPLSETRVVVVKASDQFLAFATSSLPARRLAGQFRLRLLQQVWQFLHGDSALPGAADRRASAAPGSATGAAALAPPNEGEQAKASASFAWYNGTAPQLARPSTLRQTITPPGYRTLPSPALALALVPESVSPCAAASGHATACATSISPSCSASAAAKGEGGWQATAFAARGHRTLAFGSPPLLQARPANANAKGRKLGDSAATPDPSRPALLAKSVQGKLGDKAAKSKDSEKERARLAARRLIRRL